LFNYTFYSAVGNPGMITLRYSQLRISLWNRSSFGLFMTMVTQKDHYLYKSYGSAAKLSMWWAESMRACSFVGYRQWFYS